MGSTSPPVRLSDYRGAIMRKLCTVTLLLSSFAPIASGAYITIYGGPTFDETTATGYASIHLSIVPGSTAGNGAAVGWATKASGGQSIGVRAVRWDASGAAATELGHLGTDSRGRTESKAYAINSAGTAAGLAAKYSGDTDLGSRAIRWDATGAATELDNLGTHGSGFTASYATAINSAGTVTGDAHKWSRNTSLGYRAVRWDASGTDATELGNLGTNSSGVTNNRAYAINSPGAVAGYANKYSGGTALGDRAVRWDASGTAATELGHLGTRSTGITFSYAHDINDAGVAVGYAAKYSSGTYFGNRAVRWDTSATAATELGNLGTDSSGFTLGIANFINNAGTAAGYAERYSGGASRGIRAVRWDASGTATELGNLGTDSSGFTRTEAHALNSAGVVVGYANEYGGNLLLGTRAVLWNVDAIALDLNTWIDPASGWTLTDARGISDTNWVTGMGSFDPDGSGPLAAYQRAFLFDASSAIPEPAGLSLLALGPLALQRRRRNGMFRRVGAPQELALSTIKYKMTHRRSI